MFKAFHNGGGGRSGGTAELARGETQGVDETEPVMLEVHELGYLPRLFGPVTFSLGSGEMVFLGGLSGSGKSTLCELICGQLEGSFGSIEWGEDARVGYVAQEFENQLLGNTVEQELVLSAPELLASCWEDDPCLRPFEVWRHRDPHHLPAQLQQRLVLEALCRSGTQVLILDESLATFDSQALETTMIRLQGLAEEGAAILLVSHDLRLLPYCTRLLGIESGRIAFDLPVHRVGVAEVGLLGLWGGCVGEGCAAPFSGSSAKGLGRGWSAGGLSAPAGTLVGLPSAEAGLEGAYLMALGDPRSEPTVTVVAGARASVARLPFRARSVLWRRSVAYELEESLRQGGSAAEEGLVPASWLERNPRQLSVGQSRYLAALCLVLQRPDLLLLEEPFLGLDGILRANLVRALRGYLNREGAGIFVSRHPDELELYSGSLAMFSGGDAPAALEWTPGERLPNEVRSRVGAPMRERQHLERYLERYTDARPAAGG